MLSRKRSERERISRGHGPYGESVRSAHTKESLSDHDEFYHILGKPCCGKLTKRDFIAKLISRGNVSGTIGISSAWVVSETRGVRDAPALRFVA